MLLFCCLFFCFSDPLKGVFLLFLPLMDGIKRSKNLLLAQHLFLLVLRFNAHGAPCAIMQPFQHA